MTPIELMNLFNKKYNNRKEAYKLMQKNYIDNRTKKGLFSDLKFVKSIEKGGFAAVSSLGQAQVNKEIELINKNPLLSNKEKLEAKDRFLQNYSSKTANELILGTFLFGTWRNSLGIYSLDENIASQAMSSLIPDETPSLIFSKLPEWCVYVELPKNSNITVSQLTTESLSDSDFEDKIKTVDVKVLGFWAMHDKTDPEKDNIGVGHDENMSLAVTLHLDYPEDAIVDNIISATFHLPLASNMTINESMEKQYKLTKRAVEESDRIISMFKISLSLLLWLCVEEPDVSNIKGVQLSRSEMLKPKYSRNKKTGAFIPPDTVQRYQIGKRLGGEMLEHEEEIAKASGTSGKRMKPHIRKGHWHGVWRGVGDERKFDTYWQSAIFVNSKK